MAKATKNVKTVETIESVTLTVTLDEAQRIKALAGRCSHREGLSGIFSALSAAGIGSGGYDVKTNRDNPYVSRFDTGRVTSGVLILVKDGE